MTAQGRAIGGWGPNVNVKIPVTDTACSFMGAPIAALSKAGVVVNVQANMTPARAAAVADTLQTATTPTVAVFIGRIATTGRARNPGVNKLQATPRARSSVGLTGSH